MRLLHSSILTALAMLASVYPQTLQGQDSRPDGRALQQPTASTTIKPADLWSPRLRFESVDDFSLDTRGNYVADPPPKWQPGRLTIHAGESLTAAINSGPEAFIQLHLASTSDKDHTHDLQVVFILDGAEWCAVEFRSDKTEAGLRGTIRIVDSLTQNNEVRTRLVREHSLPLLPKIETLSVHYRYGVIAVSIGDKVVVMGHVPRGAESVRGCFVGAGAKALDISKLTLKRTAQPTPRTKQEERSVENLLKGYQDILLLSQQGQMKKATDAGNELLVDGLSVIKTIQPTSVNIVNDIAWLHHSNENHERAKELYSEAVSLWQNLLSPFHPEFCRTLNNYGHLCEAVGDLDRAGTLYEKAASIQLHVNGESSSDYAAALVTMAVPKKQLSQFDEAESLYQTAVKIFRDSNQTAHPEYATAMLNLCSLYLDRRDYETAGPLGKTCVEQMLQLYGRQHDNYLRSLLNLAIVAQYSGDFKTAESLLTEALAIHNVMTDQPDVTLALIQNNLGELHREIWQLKQAIKFFSQALATRESLPGRHVRSQAITLVNLADTVSRSGDRETASGLFEKAVAIFASPTERQCPEYARALTALGNFLREHGDYQKAMTHLEAAMQIYSEVSGKDHPDYLMALHNLGAVHQSIGNYRQALTHYTQALQMNFRGQPKMASNAAMTLNNLAAIYRLQGKFAEAHDCLLQSLEFSRSYVGDNHPSVALATNSLGVLLDEEDKLNEALTRFREAATIWEQLDLLEHPDYATVLQNLAGVYLRLGDTANAEILLQQALRTQTKRFGATHPDLALTLHHLATLATQQGDDQKAAEFYRRAFDVAVTSLNRAAMLQSTRQQVWNQNRLRIHLFALLSHSVKSKRTARETLEDLWAWKGAATSRQSNYLQLSADPDLVRIMDRYRHISRQLSFTTRQIPLPPPKSANEAEIARHAEIRAAWKENLRDLNLIQESLEQQIAAIAELKQPASNTITVADLQDNLPRRTALIEFMKYSHQSSPDETRVRSEANLKYLAFVVRPDREPVILSLGSASELEDLITKFRRPFGKQLPSSAIIKTSQAAAFVLRKKIWEPIEQHLSETDVVLVSPDAAIGTLPFAALPGRTEDRFLLEDYQLAIVPSARQLTGVGETQPETTGPASLLLVGDIDYGTANHPADGEPNNGIAIRLPGFQKEATAIREAFRRQQPESALTQLRGAEATETEFLKLASQHSLLHVATHGFFAQPPEGIAGSNDITQVSLDWQPTATDPLLRNIIPELLSGLAFAGCNTEPESLSQLNDGILHTLEIESASLQNVDTVVLSACETGLGTAIGGEGLTSVQRAFHVAGAKTVVASLWKVDDAATVAFMTEFYANLLTGKMGKAEALRQAQLTMIERYDPTTGTLGTRGLNTTPRDNTSPKPAVKRTAQTQRLPPNFWAAFQLSGEWR